MSTNYYLYEKPTCECCGRDFEAKHIGKSAGGWCFALRIYPEDGIHELSDWITRWSVEGAVIKNEYGDVVDPKDMVNIVTDRSWKHERKWSLQDYLSNHAEEGPNNLVRSVRDGKHCVGHGVAGTYDLILGEFS